MRLFLKGCAGFAFSLFAYVPLWAGLLYEPTDYAAQTNLLLHLDGIRNVGILKAHDETAKKWIDLSVNANFVSFGNVTGSGVTSEWVDDGYRFGGDFGIIEKTITLGNLFTIQIVCDVDTDRQTSSYPMLFGTEGEKCSIYTYGTGDEIMFNTNGRGANLGLEGWDGRYFTGLYNKAKKASFQDVTGTVGIGTLDATIAAYRYCLGSAYKAGDAAYAKSRCLNGTIKAVRIYNRVLSEDELRQNRALDEARFFSGIPVTNVVVASSVADVDGNESVGAYAIDADGYIFSSPQKSMKDGQVYACAGYTLEVWNGSGWSEPVFTAATRYVAKNTKAKVRLTWQWKKACAAAPTALDVRFNDYVTDGLILHLDGIRNVGKDKPHDWNASSWVDLAGGGEAVIFHDDEDDSTWLEDGYRFGGRSFARFMSPLKDLEKKATIQVVCEADTNALEIAKTDIPQWIRWPRLVGCCEDSGNALCLFYDLSTKPHQPTFKSSSAGANAYLGQGVWDGRYVTAVRDGGTKWILQGTTIDGGVKVSGTTDNDIPDLHMVIGCGGDTFALRRQCWYLGQIKSVRIYNRVLSDEELARNRLVDEIRFFGAKDSAAKVVVASSVRGVSGVEMEGEYALPSEGYTFTAPEVATVGEDVYTCTGYTLETWDGTSWGSPIASTALSCKVGGASEKIRLTWTWTHTAGSGYDAVFNDYVTDGLILHLDGIRNAGLSPIHDGQALEWTDLVARGGAARFVKRAKNDTSAWMKDGYYFDNIKDASHFNNVNNANYAIMNGPRTLGASYTVQSVLDFNVNDSPRINVGWPAVVGTSDYDHAFRVYYNQNNTGEPNLTMQVASQKPGFQLKSWQGDYLTVLSDDGNVALFSEALPTSYQAFGQRPGTRYFTFASSDRPENTRFYAHRFTGEIKSMRFYDRKLTYAELERNRAVDEVRFFGRAPVAPGMLIVSSTVDGLGGAQPCGVYSPVAGYKFTARESALLDDITYELKGWTLETWNGSGWSVAESGTGTSVVPDVSSVSKRLVWKWAVKTNLTKIPDYDVGDYVQDGLLLHLDGIRNAGADVEHDPNAEEWVNLGKNGSAWNAVFDYADIDQAGDGWESDGYRFRYGGKFARLKSDPAFNWNVTVQIVCEAERSGKVSGNTSPTYFGSTNDYLNIFGYRDVAQAFIQIRNNVGHDVLYEGNETGGGRSEVLPSMSWEGRYLTAIWHGGKSQIFQEPVPAAANWSGIWRKHFTAFKNHPFYIGGVFMEGDDEYVNNRRLTGKIQSVRVYNRSLLDKELEWNRMIDEARFKGNPPKSNVVVTTRYAAVGTATENLSETTGSYKVDGIWTFTATAVKDRRGLVKPVEGYYIEELVDGVWMNRRWHFGQSYTYNETSGKTVRLTWSAPRDGTRVIFR